jgi:hypothetical protein
MSGYLDEYGIADERRERLLKRLALLLVAAASLGAILYFQFRNYREERQIGRFLSLLEQQDYGAAYALWGCTAEVPCPQYPYAKFIEDWGAQARYGNLAGMSQGRTRSCAEGIIRTLRYPSGEEAWLYVDRRQRVISFSPWPVCHPRISTSSLGK